MTKDDEILESLIAGGIIGAALGALLSGNKSKETILGALAGSAILATFKAFEQAKKTEVPVCVEEDGIIYEIQPGGEKKIIKKIDKPSGEIPEKFKLR